jgi:hypothetical protein
VLARLHLMRYLMNPHRAGLEGYAGALPARSARTSGAPARAAAQDPLELGETTSRAARATSCSGEKADLPSEARGVAERGVNRLASMPAFPERSVAHLRQWLLISVRQTDDNLDLAHARGSSTRTTSTSRR